VAYRVEFKGQSITFAGDMDATALGNLEQLAKSTDLLVVHAAILDPPDTLCAASPSCLGGVCSVSRIASQARSTSYSATFHPLWKIAKRRCFARSAPRIQDRSNLPTMGSVLL
jgi:hypothetical protein